MKFLKRHSKKIAFTGAVILLLVFMYLWGGNNAAEKNTEKTESYEPVINVSVDLEESDSGEDITESETVTKVVPLPEEESISPETEDRKSCTITIKCDTILNNMEFLDEAKHLLIPPDGIILAEKEVTFSEGESVFDVLLRETRNNRIHMEFVKSPIYDSAYIEGIHNLYEFDCGELSGWMYSVNGWFPNYGCSKYILKDGDQIEWVYTCNLGNDVKKGVHKNE